MEANWRVQFQWPPLSRLLDVFCRLRLALLHAERQGKSLLGFVVVSLTLALACGHSCRNKRPARGPIPSGRPAE